MDVVDAVEVVEVQVQGIEDMEVVDVQVQAM